MAAAAASRPARPELHDARPARAVADQPLVRARPRPRPLADRVARRAGHDVFCIDWGTPGAEDRYLTWDDIAGRYIGRAVRIATRYGRTRQGATSSATASAARSPSRHVAAFPEYVAVAPRARRAGRLRRRRHHVDVDAHADVRRPRDRRGVRQRAVAADAGELSTCCKPTLTAQKLVALLDRAWDDEFLEGFLATERWGTDNVSFPGACYAQYIEQLYRGNALIHGGFTLAGRPGRALARSSARRSRSRSSDDHIVPLPSGVAARSIASPPTDKQLVVQRGGHVGAVVSKQGRGSAVAGDVGVLGAARLAARSARRRAARAAGDRGA